MMPFGIIHPIKKGWLADVHRSEGMVRGQAIIIERSCVIRRLRPILLFAFAFLGLDAFVGGIVAFFI
jgi:hypothetical protein